MNSGSDDKNEGFLVQDQKSGGEYGVDGNKYEGLVNFDGSRVQTQDPIDTLDLENDSNSDDDTPVMPRSKSGVTRQGPSNVQVKKALAAVKDGMSQRKACEEFSVSRATLQRLLERNETEADNYKPYKNCAVTKNVQ
ncbi:hypothetical protein JTB14_027989 [Gonioctena quinquepunctata]|nr:hypothetical protein JTB14_027989 [Gonioctena quinquepunctata]